MSRWLLGSLDDVLTEVNDRNATGAVELVLSVTEGRGIVPQTEVFKKRIATNDTVKYKVVAPLDIAWNPYLLWTGAVGQWLGSEPGVTSPVYPIFRARENQEARFWGLVLESGLLTPYFDSTAIGSIQRRRRTTLPVFKAASVHIPSPVEQRRIVDVMAAVDTQIAALGAELEAFQAALGPLISGLLSQGGASWPVKRLDEIGTFTRGRRFTKADYVESGLSAIHYGQIHTDLGLITTEALTYLSENLRDRMRRASPGDVVIAATSENVEDLGNATVWLGNDDAAVHDDANIFKHDLDPVFAGCLFFSPEFQQQKVQYAAGTKVTRISSGNLGKIEVPVPTNRADQERIGNAVRAFSHAIEVVEADLMHLRSFRSALLAALLNQEIEIPESYDRPLEEVS